MTVTLIPDKTLLIQTITDEVGSDHGNPVYNLTQSDYTTGTWSAYTSAISSAITVEDDVDATLVEVANAISGIQSAKAALIFSGQADLDFVIAQAQALLEADYTAPTWATLQSALALPATNNTEIVAKTVAILSAISGLVFAGQADLDTVVSEINALDQSDYTTASWSAFQTARDTALALPETSNVLVVDKREALLDAENLLFFDITSTTSTPSVTIIGSTEVLVGS